MPVRKRAQWHHDMACQVLDLAIMITHLFKRWNTDLLASGSDMSGYALRWDEKLSGGR